MLLRAFGVISLLVLINPVTLRRHLHPLSDEFIEHINSKQSLWTAGRNFHRLTPVTYLRTLAGTIESNRELTHMETSYNFEHLPLPENFDARARWPHCPTLNDIRDQGSCGSCWAMAAASAMTDRICIKSNGTNNVYLSADDVLTCCQCSCGKGCKGGRLVEAWKYFKRVGIVTGGHYNSKQGCKPYEIKPCDHNKPSKKPCKLRVITPECKRNCIADNNIKYGSDIHKCKGVILLKNNTMIQANIFEYGPVTTFFTVYNDFFSYKHGIYTYTSGSPCGNHSVKLIGWGVEDGVEYWLAANSWNTNWGDNGFFKIKRNTNECRIEDNVVAGYAV